MSSPSIVKKIYITINENVYMSISFRRATPLTTAVSATFSLDKKCVYSVAECLYGHIIRDTFQTRALTSLLRHARVKRVRKRYCAHSALSSVAHTNTLFICTHKQTVAHTNEWL